MVGRSLTSDQWRVRVADPATGHVAEPFDCFYDVSDPGRVIAHKTYSRADVVHCMLWPSLVDPNPPLVKNHDPPLTG